MRAGAAGGARGREGGATAAVVGVAGERDGPAGCVWALAAAAVRLGPACGRPVVAEVFEGQVRPAQLRDAWTRERVASRFYLSEYPSHAELHEAFGAWWLDRRDGALCVADGGAAGAAFGAWAGRDPAGRRGLAPDPLHELGTALWTAGYDPALTDRAAFCDRGELSPHDPLDRATAAALCMARLAAARGAGWV